jgi:kynurenine formamidase
VRKPPDSRFEGWVPPSYAVDADGKVIGAKPGPVHNWGRWGDLDQRGTANLLTSERARLATTLVRTGETHALGLPMGRGGPTFTSRAATQHVMTRTTGDHLLGDPGPRGVQSADDVVVLPLQGATQLDGHAHVASQDTLFNGFWAGMVTARSGARRLGIHHQAEGIVGRGVLLDVAGVEGIDSREAVIDVPMLERTARRHGVEPGPGDILLVRTGVLSAWLASAERRPRAPWSGLSADTIPWLAERDIALVAADNPTVEAVPSGDPRPALPFHLAALRDLGLLLGELFDLDALAEACAADGAYTFLFVAMPLPIVNAVGSPLNPLAVK